MRRAFMQIYVRDSVEAVAFYQRAFDAPLGFHGKDENGMFMHAELEVNGGVIAVGYDADGGDARVTGNTMQFCLQFGDGGEARVRKAFDVLREGGRVSTPPGPFDWSPCATDVTDRYGVRWCLFV